MTCVNYTTKICSLCKIEKNTSEFYRRNTGFKSHCKKCDKKWHDEYGKTKEGVVTRIYSVQLGGSKKRSHSLPNYTNEELRIWLFNQDEFHRLYDLWAESGYDKMKKPSCDRLDDYKPYSFDNIQVITWQENKNKLHSDQKNGRNNKNSRPVIQTDLVGRFIKEHYSQSQASRDTGVNQGNIGSCCRGMLKEAGGFKWMFASSIS